MKTLAILVFILISSNIFNTNDMLAKLKEYIKDKQSNKIIKLISTHPEILDLKDDNGSSGLLLIAYSDQEEAFKVAKELKKSFNFHEAIVCGKEDIVKKSLKKEKEIMNAYSNDGFTPLSLAAFFDQSSIAKLLLENGANPNLKATNPSKVNALHSAVAKENVELCRLFIRAGVDINATQTQNVTALHSAVHRGNLELVKLLVENGAEMHLKMDNGDSAYSIAEREGHRGVLTYLNSL